MFLVMGKIFYQQGCTDIKNYYKHCMDLKIDEYNKEILRVVCCRYENRCNFKLIKTYYKEKWDEIRWAGLEVLSNTAFITNINSSNVTTFFGTYLSFEIDYLWEPPISTQYSLIVRIFFYTIIGILSGIIFCIVIFGIVVKVKKLSALDLIQNILFPHEFMSLEESGKNNPLIEKLFKINNTSITNPRSMGGKIGGYRRYIGHYGSSFITTHTYDHYNLKNFINELNFFETKPRCTYIIDYIMSAYLTDKTPIDAHYGDCRYFLFFSYWRCVSFYGFLEYLSEMTSDGVILHVFSLVHGLVQGLKYLHFSHESADLKRPVLHRCIYPHSLYIRMEGSYSDCKISNFQYSVILDRRYQNKKIKNLCPKKLLGPIDECKEFILYIAPEFILSKKRKYSVLDLSSDVYSMAVVIWQLYSAAYHILDFKLLNCAARASHNYLTIRPLEDIYSLNKNISRKELFSILTQQYQFYKYTNFSKSKHHNLLDNLVNVIDNCFSYPPSSRYTSAKLEVLIGELSKTAIKNFKS
ncbi:hypothetical protein HZS_3613 [Henneguya salminicola]|nr:hypothetical protein HZS_3613 [Henneguya salminicola]